MGLLRTAAAVVVTAVRRLGCERVPEAAASMGFYAVFSLFPLLLIVVAVASRFVEAADAQERLLGLVLRFMPVSRELVRQNVLEVVRVRAAVGGIGALGLVWSSTSAFSTLVRNLNRAWPSARTRHLLVERLLALAIVGSLVLLVLLYLVAKALVSLPGDWMAAQLALASVVEAIPLPSTAVIVVFILIVLTLLYRWLPTTLVLWREAAAGAAAAAFVLWAATTAFMRFLGEGLVSYNLIYGSLGALLALLSWVYIASVIVLSGAHLAAAIAKHTRNIQLPEGAVEDGGRPTRQ